MAVDNEIILIILVTAFNLFVLQKRFRYLPGIIYLGIGIAIMSFNTGNIYAITGLLFILGGIATAIYDVIGRKKGK